MREGLRRLFRAVGSDSVENTAACARALTGLLGRVPAAELLPGGPAEVSRAMLTARILATREAAPWPCAISRQLDPEDPAYLPALGLHPVLAARELSRLGLPGQAEVAGVDPWGWAGVGEGPCVSVGVGLGDGLLPVAPGPGVEVEQARSDTGVGVRTLLRAGPLELVLVHWPILLDGRVAFAIHARLDLSHGPPQPARLAFAIRPVGFEGTSPIFRLERDDEGLWSADGQPLLAVATPGDEVFGGVFGETDPWNCLLHAEKPSRKPGRLSLRCAVGQASAVEVSRTLLTPGVSFTRLAVLAPPRGTPATLVRTSGPSLWGAANADRLGLLSAGCSIQLRTGQAVFEAARVRLMLGDAEERASVAGCLGASALARLGFVRRAGERLGRWLGQVGRVGRYPGLEPEEGAVLAWAASNYVLWTADRSWRQEHQAAWSRLLDRLTVETPGPGGRAIFGTEGSARWSAIWRAAGLLGSAGVLTEVPGRSRWALAGGAAQETLPETLGNAPWSAAVGRVSDGAASGLLAAVWLGLVHPEAPAVLATIRHLRSKFQHGGGVLLQGGAHVGASALLLGAELRAGIGGENAIAELAALASPTGALPSARHATRGVVGDGDDALSAALFLLTVLDRVQVSRGKIVIFPGIEEASDLPTPYGRIDLRLDSVGGPAAEAQVVGRWRGKAPLVLQGSVSSAGRPPPA